MFTPLATQRPPQALPVGREGGCNLYQPDPRIGPVVWVGWILRRTVWLQISGGLLKACNHRPSPDLLLWDLGASFMGLHFSKHKSVCERGSSRNSLYDEWIVQHSHCTRSWAKYLPYITSHLIFPKDLDMAIILSIPHFPEKKLGQGTYLGSGLRFYTATLAWLTCLFPLPED